MSQDGTTTGPVGGGARPSVSCIVPTFRRPDMLTRALESIDAQALTPQEVVVVDDDPNGSAEQVTGRFRQRSEASVGYLRTGGAGPSAARNAGAAAASGAWLAFLDDDDRWAPGYLEEAVAAGDASDASYVVTWAWMEDDDGRRRPGYSMPAVCSWMEAAVRNPGMTGSNVLIRSAAFHDLGGFDEDLFCSNDKDLIARLLRARLPYAVVRRRLVFVQGHTGQRVTTSSHERRAESLARYIAKYRDLPDRHVARLRLSLARARWHAAVGMTDRLEVVGDAVRAGLTVGPRATLEAVGGRMRTKAPR